MVNLKAKALRSLIDRNDKKRKASQADDNPFGTPINYSHLSDDELERKYNEAIASVPCDVSEFEAMAVPELIQAYTALLG